jgi:hypothetical protein
MACLLFGVILPRRRECANPIVSLESGLGRDETQGCKQCRYSKISRHIIQLMLLAYIIAYLDHVNVGFARLQMPGDLDLVKRLMGFFWKPRPPSSWVLHADE